MSACSGVRRGTQIKTAKILIPYVKKNLNKKYPKKSQWERKAFQMKLVSR